MFSLLAIYCSMDPNFQARLWQRNQTIGKDIQKWVHLWQREIPVCKDFGLYLSHLSHACVKGKFPVRSWMWPLGVLEPPQAKTRSKQDLIQGGLHSNWLPQPCYGTDSMVTWIFTQQEDAFTSCFLTCCTKCLYYGSPWMYFITES